MTGDVTHRVEIDLRPVIVIAVDPGPTESAWLVYNRKTGGIRAFAKVPNEKLVELLRSGLADDIEAVVLESVESFGMPVGRDVFETVYWSGIFAEAVHPLPVYRIGRKAVKLALCGSARAKDPNIRAALIDRYGGQDVAIGRKAHPGQLYGISGDVWSALAVAVAWSETAS